GGASGQGGEGDDEEEGGGEEAGEEDGGADEEDRADEGGQDGGEEAGEEGREESAGEEEVGVVNLRRGPVQIDQNASGCGVLMPAGRGMAAALYGACTAHAPSSSHCPFHWC